VTLFGLLLTPVFYVLVRRAARHAATDPLPDSPAALPVPEAAHD